MRRDRSGQPLQRNCFSYSLYKVVGSSSAPRDAAPPLTRGPTGSSIHAMKKPKPKDPPRPDYGDATPEDVAKALLLHRPGQKRPKQTHTQQEKDR